MREIPVHFLKTHQGVYLDMAIGSKNFELRFDDRKPSFDVGHFLVEQEIRVGRYEDENLYTGNEQWLRILYVLRGPLAEQYGLKRGFCAMGVSPVKMTHMYYNQNTLKLGDKFGYLLLDSKTLPLVNTITSSWLIDDWTKYLKTFALDLNVNTLGEAKLDFVRRAEKWYLEEEIAFLNFTVDEKVTELRLYLERCGFEH